MATIVISSACSLFTVLDTLRRRAGFQPAR